MNPSENPVVSESGKSSESGAGSLLDIDLIRPMEVPGTVPSPVSVREVPSVPLGTFTPGEDVDFSQRAKPETHKPDLNEKFHICIEQLFETVLLIHKTGVKGMDVNYYFVNESLQRELAFMIKPVVIIPWWSLRDSRWYLWIINASEKNPYYSEFKPYLEEPLEYYQQFSFTVRQNDEKARWDLQKYKETKEFHRTPGRATGVMLAQAIGSKGFIDKVDHPLYVLLTSGEPA